jgi:uncharacterized protein (TIGR02217 family)
MSFHEVRFPEGISYGAVGGPTFKTSVLELASGQEKRNVNWSLARQEWDVAHGIKTQTELDELLAFFYARGGRAYGFRFKNWADFLIDSVQQIGLGDGVETEFQAIKTYTSGGIAYDHPLKKLVSGTVEVYLDGVEVNANDYSVDLNTGVITFDTAPAATGGTGPDGEQVVGLTCEFDVPVRFDTDVMAATIEDFNVHSWNSIILKELRL